jgi:hypothetical protein
MNIWQYLDRAGQRMAQRESRIIPADFRGWVAFGLFVQSSSLFGLMWLNHTIMDNQGFMTLASAVVVTGWIGGVAAFAYSGGKREGEQSAALASALNLATNLAPPAVDAPPDVVLQPGETAQAQPEQSEGAA